MAEEKSKLAAFNTEGFGTREYKGRVLFLPQNNKNPQMWAPILIENWARIKSVLLTRSAPFVAKLSPNGVWGIKELNRYGREKKKRKRS